MVLWVLCIGTLAVGLLGLALKLAGRKDVLQSLIAGTLLTLLQ